MRISQRETKERKDKKRILADAVTLFLGSFLFALAFQSFFLPCGIVIGGVSGLSTVFYYAFKIPVGVMILLLNLPIFYFALRRYGMRALIRSAVGTATTSLFLDFFFFLPPLVSEPLLAAACGGALLGIATALFFSRGFTTGGTDLFAMLLHEKVPAISVSRFILFADIAVISVGALVHRELNGIFYSLATIFSFSFLLEYTQKGANSARVVYIMSEESAKIASAISSRIKRGVTVFYGRFWFSQKEAEILLCTLRTREVYPLRTLIEEIDPNAFFIVAEATEVYGNRFLPKRQSYLDI